MEPTGPKTTTGLPTLGKIGTFFYTNLTAASERRLVRGVVPVQCRRFLLEMSGHIDWDSADISSRRVCKAA